MAWAHPDFRASAMTADGSVFGIVAPVGGEGPNAMMMELSGVPYRAEVAPGTTVYTAGLGGVYPRGIPLGRVLAVRDESEGWSRTYLVHPAVHPAGASHVMVLLGTPEELGGTFPPPATAP
jgi:rod shape-determining protein MreC